MLEQRFCQAHHRLAILFNNLARSLVLFSHDLAHFGIDANRSLFRVIAMLCNLAAQKDLLFLLSESQRAEIRHAILANHRARQLGRFLNVVGGASRNVAEECLFGDAAAQQNRDVTEQICLRVIVTIAFRQLLRDAEGHAARNDRDFVHGVGVRNFQADESVTGFVISRHSFLFVRDDHALAFGAHQDFVFGQLEIRHRHNLLVIARRVQRRFINQVGEIRAGKPRGAASDNADVHVFAERNLAGMNFQNAFAPAHVGPRYNDSSIKPTGPQQRRIEDVRPVGGGDENDVVLHLEAVHLDQELVERLLALVVTATESSASVPADRVDLVDEDDARRVLLALLEQIAHPRGAHADKHFNKVRT